MTAGASAIAAIAILGTVALAAAAILFLIRVTAPQPSEQTPDDLTDDPWLSLVAPYSLRADFHADRNAR